MCALSHTGSLMRALHTSLRLTFLLVFAVAVTACVAASPADSIPERGGQDSGRSLPDIVALPDADDPDGDLDASPGDTTDDTDPEDSGPDVAVLDVQFDTASDVAVDADTGGDTTVDARDTSGPCTGLGCPCTVSTRATICGVLQCVDGVCCESSCNDDCAACDLPGQEGTCAFHPVGTDPEDDCRADSTSSCGQDGYCDGAGGCSLYGSDTSCNDGEACSVGDVCDGAGTCRGEVPGTCGPGAGNECCVGTCTDGAGCGTAAAPCGDVCGASELTIGRSCSGCGAAGAVGVCSGGGTHVCNERDHDECRELTCGGVRYWCTNDGGSWAWRPAGTCDDGNDCTYDDRCGGGTCGGTAVDCTDTVCADRECNGTATCDVIPNPGASCEDGDLCTYGDTCNADGVCAGGSTITCADAPCIDRACTGGPTCSETILTGSACDDGQACTYDDTCSAAGVCVAGGSVSCDGLDTTCLSYACDGSPFCAATPINVGGVCNDGDPATDFDQCQPDGECLGDTGCPPPSEACVAGTQNRRGCNNARVISRLAAGGGYLIADSTCRAYDDFNSSGSCWDGNRDHAYRLYMREGEVVTVRYLTTDPCDCCESSWSGTLKIFETGGCDDRSCGDRVYCEDYERDQSETYTARQDGWIVIVADGTHGLDDKGSYQLSVNLTCRDGNCGCR